MFYYKYKIKINSTTLLFCFFLLQALFVTPGIGAGECGAPPPDFGLTQCLADRLAEYYVPRVINGGEYEGVFAQTTSQGRRVIHLFSSPKQLPVAIYDNHPLFNQLCDKINSQCGENPLVFTDKICARTPFAPKVAPNQIPLGPTLVMTAPEPCLPGTTSGRGVPNGNSAIDEIFSKGSPIRSGPGNPRFRPQGFGGYAAAGGTLLAGVANTCSAYQCSQTRSQAAVSNNCSPGEVLGSGVLGGASDTFIYHGGNTTAFFADILKLPYDIAKGNFEETTFGADRNYPVCSPQRFIACKIRDRFYDPSAGLPGKIRPPVQTAPFPSRGIILTRPNRLVLKF